MIRSVQGLGVWLLVVSLLAVPACRSRRQRGDAETAPGMVSVLPMSDAHAARQLVSGFYALESGAWRWTAPKFSVDLQSPAQSATHGARLELKLVIPETLIQKVNNITLSAKVGNTPLPPETYSRAGTYDYIRDIPSSAMQANAVRIECWLNKSMPPSGSDQRELGIVVHQISLQPK